MPRKGAAPPNLYMSWLEIMTRKMPPFLLVSFHKVPKLVKKCLNWLNSTKQIKSNSANNLFYFNFSGERQPNISFNILFLSKPSKKPKTSIYEENKNKIML
jgi:hypothetical protein